MTAIGCRHRPATTVEPPERIVLVTIDTLRADHLGCYGYPRPTTPFLDQLARHGVLFRRALASSSHTAPAHASIFTSLELPQHRVTRNGQHAFDPSIQTLAQVVGERGYETAACSDGRGSCASAWPQTARGSGPRQPAWSTATSSRRSATSDRR